MSIPAMNWVWALRLKSDEEGGQNAATRKLILLKFADNAHGDEGRHAWCPPATLAAFAECSERTAQRIVTWAVAEGYMRPGDQGSYRGEKPPRFRPIVYDLAMDEETRLRWKEDARAGVSLGVRGYHQAHGTAGGKAGAEKRWAESRRGDSVTPLTGGRGDSVTPLQMALPGPDDTPSGVTESPVRGDTAVSHDPPLDPPLEPKDKPRAASDANPNATDSLPGLPAPSFADFWAVYPLRKVRKKAEAAWVKAITRAAPEVIIAGAAAYRDEPGRKIEFTAHPTTWLNGDRWTDERPDRGWSTGRPSILDNGNPRDDTGSFFGTPTSQPDTKTA